MRSDALLLGRAFVCLGVSALLLSGCGASAPGATEPTTAGQATGSPSSSPLPAPVGTATPTQPAETTAPSQPADPGTEPVAGKNAVQVTISTAAWNASAGTVEVSGYAEVVEGGGTCTVVLGSPTSTVTVASEATPDVASTSCGWLAVTPTGSGTWSVQLKYDGPSGSGSSEITSIEVP